mmetsp:Transcript_65247/g.155866  ORF Transcript_65247/g.155866 Transcript_65247/m.155866 type:complete len:525 (+) Transcript_65247:184-1758(+)
MVKHVNDKAKMVEEQVNDMGGIDVIAHGDTALLKSMRGREAEEMLDSAQDWEQMQAPRPGSKGRTSLRPARTLSSTFGEDAELAHEMPQSWTLKRFQDDVKELLDEYFRAGDLQATVRRTRELLAACPSADEFGVIAIRCAMDGDEDVGRYNLKLLCALNKHGIIDDAGFVRSFEKLFCTWEDIMMDAPKAPVLILRTLQDLVAGGVPIKALYTKVPEGLLKAADAKEESAVSEVLRGVAANLKEFKKKLTPCIEEYFVALNDEEVEIFLKELNMLDYHHEFVKKVATHSFSTNNITSARDSVITLFGHLSTRGLLTKDDLQWGITRLLSQLDDLTLDCPHAIDHTTELLCAMVSDELVGVPFLRRCTLLRIGGLSGVQVLKNTQRRTPEYSKRYLDTAQFKKELQTMIEEYLNAGDVAEFTRCVRDLAPNEAQSAELVRKLMTFAMERSGTECEMALQLLTSLCRDEEVELAAVEKGFDELYERMPDLILDVPDAREMARTFVVEARRAELLPSDWQEPSGPP